MPTTITTSTSATATQAFNQRKVDRNQDGTLWAVHNNGVPTAEFWYSKDNGATWTFSGTASDVLGATNSSVFIDVDDYAHFVWKQSGTGGSRSSGVLYYMRGTPNAGRTAWTWSAAVSLTGGVVSFDFPDVVACRNTSTGGWDAFIVASSVASTTSYAQYQRIPISSAGAFGTAAVDGLTLNSGMGLLSADYSTSAHTYPSIDFNHTGNGKTVAGGTPHLYIGWTAGATGTGKGVRFRKAVYSAGAWTFNAEREINNAYSLAGFAGTWMTCHFDGTRATLSGFLHGGGADPSWFLADRDAADTTTTAHIAVTVPAASYWAHGSSSFDAAGNVYVFGRDGSGANGTRLGHYRKWTRSGATMGAATTFDTTGPDAPYISAKRGYSSSSIDWVWTDGTASPYSVRHERFSLNTAPNAPTLTAPVAATTINRDATQRFSWTFSDPDAGDSQSKYDLRYRIVGAGTWTDTTGTTPNQFVDFAGGTFAAGSYEWQVRTYDAAGVVGPYSASAFFTAASAPATPTITAPVNGETLSAQEYTATWSAPSQDAYQLRTVADNAGAADTATVYTDSGTVVSTTARSRLVTFAVNNRNEHVQLRVRVSGLWSSWASVRVLVSYTPPAVPTIAVAANSPAAKIDITLSNPAPGAGQPTVASLDLLRREGGSGDGIRIATTLAAGVFSDLTPASGIAYEYKARAVATNGTTSESAWTA